MPTSGVNGGVLGPRLKACICGDKDGLLSQGAAPAMLKIDESTVRMEVPDSGVANVPDPSEKPGARGLDGRGLQ